MRRGPAPALAAMVLALGLAHAASPSPTPATKTTSSPRVPDLFDPNVRLLKPEGASVKGIRFLTTDDFPPFHFALADGTLAGFDIDLARAICAELKIPCTIQARRFETLTAALRAGEADALIAAVANTAATRQQLGFTAPYYTTPGRFVVTSSSKATGDPTPENLVGHTIGVETGTAHEAFLKAFFTKATIKPFKDQRAAREALRAGTVETIFGDGIALSLWLNGAEANGCCDFRGGPFTEARFFGNGVSIAVAKDNVVLRQLLDYELAGTARSGTYADLYLKYFPIGFY